MKIGITCYPTYGGSGAVATELGLDLADRGHEVHFISYAQPFRLDHFREGIFHYAIPHATSAWVAEEMLRGERDLKIVTTLHGTDITLVGLHPSFQAITQFSILRSHGLTAVSEFLKARTVEEMADAGISLLKDNELWTRFSDAARADSVERFSNERIIPLYEGLYRDVVAGDFGNE